METVSRFRLPDSMMNKEHSNPFVESMINSIYLNRIDVPMIEKTEILLVPV